MTCSRSDRPPFSEAATRGNLLPSREESALENFLYSIDVALLRSVNHGLSSRAGDLYFSFMTDWNNYRYAIATWFALLLIFGGRRGRVAVVSVIAAVLLADFVSSHVLKGLVERIRPCNALDEVLTPLGKRTSFSFPSSHGATMGATLAVLVVFFRRWWPLWLFLTGSVGLSRVYLGLHYPSDVSAGLIIGGLLGLGLALGTKRLARVDPAPPPKPVEPDPSPAPAQ